jgi:hypothetical protein
MEPYAYDKHSSQIIFQREFANCMDEKPNQQLESSFKIASAHLDLCYPLDNSLSISDLAAFYYRLAAFDIALKLPRNLVEN